MPGLTLDTINLRIEPGQLVGVVGPVGSSKSSLLMAVLREIAPERLAVMGTGAANPGDGSGEVRAARHASVDFFSLHGGKDAGDS